MGGDWWLSKEHQNTALIEGSIKKALLKVRLIKPTNVLSENNSM